MRTTPESTRVNEAISVKRILVISAGLHIGGAERVAANICTYAQQEQYEFHYLIFEGYENVYGPEIVQKNGKIFTFPAPKKNYFAYFKNLCKLICDNKYAAVHSHTMFNSGINMLAAQICGVPIRIAHSHTTKTETTVPAVQKIYEYIMQRLIIMCSTHYFACGVDAGKWMFGAKRFEQKGHVIRNGIDVNKFAWSVESRNMIRAKYGLDKAFLIGHSGSLVGVKNQQFLIRLMPEILKKKPNAVLMLVGGGEDQRMLIELADKIGARSRVIFTGAVNNVHEYLSAFDVFAFPSRREGTPLALLEAQANGLPCIVSSSVPDDAFLTDLVAVLNVEDEKRWIDAICTAVRTQPEVYAKQIFENGYDACSAYTRIYDAYEKNNGQAHARISLSFDDGRGDNTDVADRILLPRKIPATLNITTGYIDGSCPEELRPSHKPPMTIDDIRRLSRSNLIEIALHGDRHQNTKEDILEGCRKISQWLEIDEKYRFGFASPGTSMDLDRFRSSEFDDLRRKLRYMRMGLRLETHKVFRICCRKVGRVFRIPDLYEAAYADTMMRFRDGKIIYSVPVLRDITVTQVQAIINRCIRQKASLVLMFHSICESCDHEDNWSWDQSKFEKLCDYLVEKRDSGEVELCTTMDMYNAMD